jgi:hypothetical protein
MWELELAHRSELIARQRLRREQIQGGAFRVAHHLAREREVVDESLAARGAGGDHDVVPGADRVERLALVAVQAGHALQRQPVDEQLGQGLGETLDDVRARRQVPDVDERVLAFDRGQEGPGVHPSMVAISGSRVRSVTPAAGMGRCRAGWNGPF